MNGKNKKKFRDLRFYCLMMALPLAQFAIMFVGVNINSILLSFKQYDADMNYVWTLNNFIDVIRDFMYDGYITVCIKNSVKFFFIKQITTILPSLLISYYLYKKLPFSNGLRILLYIPSVISSVVTITVFYYICDRGFPQLVEWLTGNSEALGLLVNSDTRLGTVLFYNIFYGLAGAWLFYSSAMAGIDEGVSEAACIDGASLWQEFRYITMPLIYPVFITFFVSGLAGVLIGDYGMYAFSKASGGDALVPTMGYYFTSGIVKDTVGTTYPHYAALGLIMTCLSSIIVFSARAFMHKHDPMRNQDGSEPQRKRKRR